ncbi:MarR family winged helix-turn-helix transcriptional regulator [Actinoplanes subtropicus]|uniref:MarR family winged helix-turn-helix transcriptional regulator n=1 Tax=Actinoplanes subtropicus TaxID=543632 RepID=UPI00068EB4A2|nr:MarR family transcriptional regulator [Actinoplanes subtropicus]
MGGPARISRPDRELGDQLIELMERLRRVLIRSGRSAGLRTLTEAHATLLRTLVSGGPATPARVASELGLARPTVSNIVRELVSAELIERQPSSADGRSVSLAPTARARQQLAEFGRGRSDALARALGGLSAPDRDCLIAAAPALERLLERLTVDADERVERETGDPSAVQPRRAR